MEDPLISLFKAPQRVLLPAFCLFFFAACATAPVTGRQQLILIDSQTEQALGLEAYENILKEAKISQDPQINALIQRVGWRIAEATGRDDFAWEFKVIEAPKTINAFCLPGGKVFVYTGLLSVTENEAGLATVIGHEVAHAIARHGAERLSLVLLADMGEKALSSFLNLKDPLTRRLFYTAYGIGTNLGLILPYSRKQELEADEIGLFLMARAGYDPREALRFWEKMLELDKRRPQPPPFLATHPPDEVRLRHLGELLPRALQLYRALRLPETTFSSLGGGHGSKMFVS
ncbi:M48 family metallopeptidase [Thermosulfuriphilus ammonigenes]|uniref:M48 family metallopeptidase n=1 Tax=Thermosulfuriphilus ammonigenes TaxID=1936021 RepID=A0A6G7PXD2_9BACT|nr:M48 family metallopeptidase [Thermosulfuriphilus ammonigenes]MBA2849545.1 putative Zn-dependent protease [Thermosulfuriphilus ammonigenes]QIJ72349.1 M48 family metallopeptidase [Thermosulfuriphilus ammonigenes]